MLLSYAICVSTEVQEIQHLLRFLRETKAVDSEIVVLVDTTKNFPEDVLGKDVKIIHREFDGDFASHKNFLNENCSGDYIFNIDADEIPQEGLMYTALKIASDGLQDAVYVPRINICPGYTAKFARDQKFNINEMGWINWPDYQCRIYKCGLKWKGKVHEKIDTNNPQALEAHPKHALWHIKSIERQTRQNKLYDEINATSN